MLEIISNMLNGFQQLPGPTIYLLVASVAVAVLVLTIRFFKKLKLAAEMISDKKYRKNPAAIGLTPARQAALNVGAINSEQTMFFANSLTTGRDKNLLQENLADYYDIKPYHGSAEAALNRLYTMGHRVYFNIIKQNFSADGNNVAENYSFEDKAINREQLAYFNSNLEDSIPSLIREGFIQNQQDIAGLSVMAWDMGRLVTIARCCFDCGYISEASAWELIEGAYEESKGAYANWQEFATGYIVGRAMWGGESVSLDGLMAIAKELLNDEDSPWKQAALQ